MVYMTEKFAKEVGYWPVMIFRWGLAKCQEEKGSNIVLYNLLSSAVLNPVTESTGNCDFLSLCVSAVLRCLCKDVLKYKSWSALPSQ